MATIDHSTCTHPRTPAGRAKCRADRKKAPQVAVEATVTTPVPAMDTTPAVTPVGNFAAERKAIRAKVTKAAATPAVAAKLAEASMAPPFDEVKLVIGILRDINSDGAMIPAMRAKANEQLAIREGIDGRPCCNTCGNFRYADGVTDPTEAAACGPTYCHFTIANG
jgi:hypothetical protein